MPIRGYFAGNRGICGNLLRLQPVAVLSRRKMPHDVRMSILKKHNNIKWTLLAYDVVIVIFVELLLLVFSGERVESTSVVYHILTTLACVLAARFAGKIYSGVCSVVTHYIIVLQFLAVAL